MNKRQIAKQMLGLAKELLKSNNRHAEVVDVEEIEPVGEGVSKTKQTKRAPSARIMRAAKQYKLKKNVRTKKGDEFERGITFKVVSYDSKYPYLVRLESDDGRKFAVAPSSAYRIFERFPKPPSFRTLTKWMDDNVATALDGKRVEPDGFSPSGAPSWMLVEGLI